MRVIRFTNRDIDTNIEGVLQEIARQCGIEEESSPQRGELEGGEIVIDS